jgi:hypothetical protein
MIESTELPAWFAARLPAAWFEGELEVLADREEILVLGRIPGPRLARDAPAEAVAAATAKTVKRWRAETREVRMRVAAEAEHRFGRNVSWGVRCGGQMETFTMLSVPVMTRLRMPERAVLDTLVDSGVARSRSDALAWCVRLVGKHEGDWIADLRDALVHVERVRAEGPRD